MTIRLDVGKVVLGAFLVPWWNRRAFSRALAIPLLLLVTLTLSWYFTGEYLPELSAWLFYLGYGVLFVIFAVTCHRLVLLDPPSITSRLYPRWSLRETRFILWMVGVWLIITAAFIVVSPLLVNVSLLWSRKADEDWLRWSLFVAKLPALYVFARLCLVFPATAVDKRVNLKWAWRLSEGNGWRLVLIVAVLPWILTQLVNLLYRGNASTIETIILTFVGCALFAVEVAALSLSYRELTSDETSRSP
jgi:hypothetical protein